ncbi:tyrosine-type recombinase/integrase [Falsihalocynthiibacter sp. BN13B15]|uniref:tyrosine-type recombinase/integrase n=1 Tax=Falsihalocynthiibacter sp. BN13B15 TaxID=3240871 RepID=UPI0035102D8D
MAKSKKLPKYVRQRTWGAYQYKRNVPKRLISVVGKETIYHSLGSTYSEMITKLPVVHRAVESLFARLEGQDATDRTLALVETHYGKRAADMLAAGDIDQNLDGGLEALADLLEDEVEPEVFNNLLGASVPKKIFTLSDAYALYTEFKDAENNRNLSKYLKRTSSDLEGILGSYKFNKAALTTITRNDANEYRDVLLGRVSPNSVHRYNNTVKAVINHAVTELGISNYLNPFNKLKIKGVGNAATDRLSLSREEADMVFDALPHKDDLQAIFVTLCDTGARLAEISGLLCGDVFLQEQYVHIRPNTFRSLKTESSSRSIPLSDRAVELLQKNRLGKQDDEPLFARYGRIGGNTACSAILMKHFRGVISEPKKSLHSLRHKKKDELRRTHCPEEISKVLLGHSNKEVAARNGDGFEIVTLREHLAKTW